MLHGVKRCKNILFVAALGVLLLAGGVARTQASDNNRRCEQRIHQAEEKLRREIDRHGEHSRQAEKRRHELGQARRSCGEDRDRR